MDMLELFLSVVDLVAAEVLLLINKHVWMPNVQITLNECLILLMRKSVTKIHVIGYTSFIVKQNKVNPLDFFSFKRNRVYKFQDDYDLTMIQFDM